MERVTSRTAMCLNFVIEYYLECCQCGSITKLNGSKRTKSKFSKFCIPAQNPEIRNRQMYTVSILTNTFYPCYTSESRFYCSSHHSLSCNLFTSIVLFQLFLKRSIRREVTNHRSPSMTSASRWTVFTTLGASPVVHYPHRWQTLRNARLDRVCATTEIAIHRRKDATL